MPYNYDDAPPSCHLPRRHARSLDLDESAAKAAAWVWHLHTSKPGITTEGQFIFPQTKRRHSGTFDKKASRFQQEASTAMAKQTVQAGKSKADAEKPMWDCGSSLYDTFELVAFGNSLDRSLMDIAVPFIPPRAQPDELDPGTSLSNVSVNGIARGLSLPRSLPSLRKTREPALFYNRSGMEDLKLASNSCKDGTGILASKRPEKAKTSQRNTVAKFLSKMKKAVVLRTQIIDLGCKRSTNAIESSHIRPIIKNLNGNNSAIERSLTLNPEVIGSLSAANLSDSEGTDDRLFTDSPSFRYDYTSESRSNYKLSNPMINKNKFSYDGNYGRNQAGMPRRISAVSTDALNGGYLSANLKITPRSESLNGEQNEEIRSAGRRKHADDGMRSNGSINDRSCKELDDCVFVWNGSKLSGRTGAAVRGRIEGATEHKLSDLHKHLHHHHHHHHHHHYLHQNSKSEAARPYNQAMVCVPAEQKLTNLAG